MTKGFAERLMERPKKEMRPLWGPSPTGKRQVASYLIGVDGAYAICQSHRYKKPWVVPLEKIDYR